MSTVVGNLHVIFWVFALAVVVACAVAVWRRRKH
jgi:hypothetical protein